MSTLYVDDHLEHAAPGDLLTLGGAEAKHAASVSRVRPGEHVMVGNGRGLVVTGVVTSARPGDVVVTAESVDTHSPRTPRIHLAQALAKGNRDERAVQMCTELGVTGVIPWQAARSVSRWDAAKAAKGVQRWQTIAREASKQSLRSHIPVIDACVTTAGLAARAADSRMLVLDPLADTSLSSIRLDDRAITLVVGPEGGIEEREFEIFADAGAERVRLGPTVLRTSSAGAASLAVLNVMTGLW